MGQRGESGRQQRTAPFIKCSRFRSVRVRCRLPPGAESDAPGPRTAGGRRAPPASPSPSRPPRARRSEGSPSAARPRQPVGGSPRQRQRPSDTVGPLHLWGRPAAARAFWPGAPSTAPPGPARAHPGLAGCLIVQRRRPCSAAAAARAPARASGSGRCSAARPPLGTDRPAPPADPPRALSGRRQPEDGEGGAKRAPGPTNPVPTARPRKWEGDSSGLLKRPLPSGLERGAVVGVGCYPEGSRVGKVRPCSQGGYSVFPNSSHFLISSSCRLATRASDQEGN